MYKTDNNAKHVGAILDKLADANLSDRLYGPIAGWLVSEESRAEKERQLAERFDRSFSCTLHPSREAYVSYENFAHRYGLPVAPAKIPLHRRPVFRIAAVVIPMLMLAGGVFLLDDARPVETPAVEARVVAVGNGQTILLPDETKVVLAEGSRIERAGEFRGNRHVRLAGEAHFNVTRAADATDSFTVHTDHFEITVLGTEFRVNGCDENGLGTIDLYHGAIDVRVAARRITMGAGDRLTYDPATGEVQVSKIALSARTYDKMNDFVFDRTPIGEVFERLEAEFGVPVVVEGDAARLQTVVRGDLSSVGSIDRLMSTLQILSGQFSYEISDDRITVKILDE